MYVFMGRVLCGRFYFSAFGSDSGWNIGLLCRVVSFTNASIYTNIFIQGNVTAYGSHQPHHTQTIIYKHRPTCSGRWRKTRAWNAFVQEREKFEARMCNSAPKMYILCAEKLHTRYVSMLGCALMWLVARSMADNSWSCGCFNVKRYCI